MNRLLATLFLLGFLLSQSVTPALAAGRTTAPAGMATSFSVGSDVFAYKIKLSDGSAPVYQCVLQKSQFDGTAEDGVINGLTPGEIQNNRPCFGPNGAATTPLDGGGASSAQTVNGLSRRQTGDGKEGRFEVGEAVLGAWIEFDDKRTMAQCLVSSAPVAGKAISAAINPTVDEAKDKPEC